MCQGRRGSACDREADGRAQSEREPGTPQAVPILGSHVSLAPTYCHRVLAARPSAPEVAGGRGWAETGPVCTTWGWWVLAGGSVLSRHVSCQHLEEPRESRGPLWVPLVYQQGLASSETGCGGATWAVRSTGGALPWRGSQGDPWRGSLSTCWCRRRHPRTGPCAHHSAWVWVWGLTTPRVCGRQTEPPGPAGPRALADAGLSAGSGLSCEADVVPLPRARCRPAPASALPFLPWCWAPRGPLCCGPVPLPCPALLRCPVPPGTWAPSQASP